MQLSNGPYTLSLLVLGVINSGQPQACSSTINPLNCSISGSSEQDAPMLSSDSFPTKEVLLTSGTGFFLGMFYFYKRKQTLPFKVCYGLTWPTLGGGVMLAVTPTPEQMAQRLEHSRAVTATDLQKQRESNAATVQVMRQQFASKQ